MYKSGSVHFSSNMPVLQRLKEKFQEEFGGDFSKLPNRDNTLIVIIQHGFKTILPMMEAFLELGINSDQVFMTTKPHTTPTYPAELNHPDDTLRYFKDNFKHYVPFIWSPDIQGPERYKTLTAATHSKLLDEVCDYLLRYPQPVTIQNIIICDEGGKFLSEFIHRYNNPETEKYVRKLSDYRVVAIAHTKCDTYSKALGHLPFPLINMADSYLKTRIESEFIAKSMFVNLDLILKRIITTSPSTIIGVVGGGNVGKEVLSFLSKKYLNTPIRVYDVKTYAFSSSDITANGRTNIVKIESLPLLLEQATVILGCTGVDFMAEISKDCFAKNSTNQIHLVSCSSGDIEFQTLLQKMPSYKFESLEDVRDWTMSFNDKQLTIYNGGFPINFLVNQPGGIPAPESIPSHEIQITRGMKLVALVQALELLQVMENVPKEQDKMLKGYIQLDAEYQLEIFNTFCQNIIQNSTTEQQIILKERYKDITYNEIMQQSVGTIQPTIFNLVKFLSGEIKANNHNSKKSSSISKNPGQSHATELTPRLIAIMRDIEKHQKREIDCTHMFLTEQEMHGLTERDFFDSKKIRLRKNALDFKSKGQLSRKFSDHIQENKTYETIDLAYSELAPEDMLYFLKKMKKNTNVKILILKGLDKFPEKLRDTSSADTSNIISELTHTALEVDSENENYSYAEALGHLLKENSVLEYLDLQGVHEPERWNAAGRLDANDIHVIFSSISSTSLIFLDLWGNRLYDEGAILLAQYLPNQLRHLKFLGLGRNSIGPHGARALSACLGSQPLLLLLALDLRFNNLGDVGFLELSSIFETNKTLQRLNVENNRITRSGIDRFIDRLDQLKQAGISSNLLYISFEKGEFISFKHYDLSRISLNKRLGSGFLKEMQNDIGYWRGASIIANYLSQYPLGIISRQWSSHNESMTPRQKEMLVEILRYNTVHYLLRQNFMKPRMESRQLSSLNIEQLIDSEYTLIDGVEVNGIEAIFRVVYSLASRSLIESYLTELYKNTSDMLTLTDGIIRHEHLTQVNQLILHRQSFFINSGGKGLLRLDLSNNYLYLNAASAAPEFKLFDNFKGSGSVQCFLQELNLSNNSINDVLIASFSALLYIFFQLNKLYLSDNRFSEIGLEGLIRNLMRENCPIEQLDFSNNWVNLSKMNGTIFNEFIVHKANIKITAYGNYTDLSADLNLLELSTHTTIASKLHCRQVPLPSKRTTCHFYTNHKKSNYEYLRKSSLNERLDVTEQDWVLGFNSNVIYLEGILSWGAAVYVKAIYTRAKTIEVSFFEKSIYLADEATLKTDGSMQYALISDREAQEILNNYQAYVRQSRIPWTQDLLRQAGIINVEENDDVKGCITFNRKIKPFYEKYTA